MADNQGRVLTLYFLDNDLEGRIKCSIGGSKCLAYKINRDSLALCKDIDDLKRPGIYFLFGDQNKEDTRNVVYIGQANERKIGNSLLTRLTENKRNPEKTYWNYAIAFTTTDNSLGPTEINHLEKYFCNLAKEANRYFVKNGNEPNEGTISDEQLCSLNYFKNDTKLILAALNYKVLIPIKSVSSKPNEDKKDEIFYLERKNRKTGITIKATGQKTKDGFVVFKGSYIAEEELKVLYPTIKEMRNKIKIGKNRILQEDLLFSSPTYAAAFVTGGNANGLTSWKTKAGVQLKDIINK